MGYVPNEKTIVNDQNPPSTSPFHSIRAVDYTVIFVRDMTAMRRFYEGVLRFPLTRELSAGWIEYQIGCNTLALARPSRTAKDASVPTGSASLQLAFKVADDDVDRCADELVRYGVDLLEPPTDQPFGHRTLFFRDPDGNLLEVYAEI
ncbi:VOC family protein [Bradyrhizobium australiense]|uniref:Glyoxalase/bleomycin resistance/dioxygenase family protein n=1 Tax=Bradyrhizobium australiense TaxID=2721161 RepID=A0A7Y4LTZ5_9BRAD|nr:VOC family protein [Bradyrhizobium australiense]NOJ38220.1 glyoxalase/bleomycin resistance/dioxygenase family protein [Bradyrhizobium australiense]